MSAGRQIGEGAATMARKRRERAVIERYKGGGGGRSQRGQQRGRVCLLLRGVHMQCWSEGGGRMVEMAQRIDGVCILLQRWASQQPAKAGRL